MNKNLVSATCVLTFMYTSIFAAPASWYYWVSKIDGTRVCAQISLGEGWKKINTPYQDSQCSTPQLKKNITL